MIAFAAMIVFILGLWAIVWIGDITGLIVFDESSSCADDGKVWDEDRQECRDDCWTWNEREKAVYRCPKVGDVNESCGQYVD